MTIMQEQDAQLGWRGRKRRRNSLGSDNSSSQESSCELQLYTSTPDWCRFDQQEFQFKSPEEEVDFYIMLEETIMKEQAVN
jgi:hypothetical protein